MPLLTVLIRFLKPVLINSESLSRMCKNSATDEFLSNFRGLKSRIVFVNCYREQLNLSSGKLMTTKKSIRFSNKSISFSKEWEQRIAQRLQQLILILLLSEMIH